MSRAKYLKSNNNIVFHKLDETGKAKCGVASAGDKGYTVVEKERPPLTSMICSN